MKKVLKNFESGHSWHKCGFFPNGIFKNCFENLPELGNSVQEETKMILIYFAGYICC